MSQREKQRMIRRLNESLPMLSFFYFSTSPSAQESSSPCGGFSLVTLHPAIS
jgi:hypothetical protein